MEKYLDEEYFKQRFTVQRTIGNGSFGSIFKCFDNYLGKSVALKKLLWQLSPSKIYTEIEAMLNITKLNCPNTTHLIHIFRFIDTVFIEMDYFRHDSIYDIIFRMNNEIISIYLHDLLTGILALHSQNYIHRDIKPENFLFDFKNKIGVLCDFGFCEKQKKNNSPPNKSTSLPEINLKSIQNDLQTCLNDSSTQSEDDNRTTMQAKRAGTRGYRAPEVLWKSSNQTTAIDIWSVGIIFLSLLSRKVPFLSRTNDLTDLYEISCIIGRTRLQMAALACGRFLVIPDNGQKEYSLIELVSTLNPDLESMKIPTSAFDLLEKMLDPNPNTRITAQECLQHPYFNSQ